MYVLMTCYPHSENRVMGVAITLEAAEAWEAENPAFSGDDPHNYYEYHEPVDAQKDTFAFSADDEW